MDNKEKTPPAKKPFVPMFVRSLITILLTGVVAYKVIITPCSLQFDFNTFLSLAVALFAVVLSALFYFKATDTSNAFYDNTYKFTQDIAELLVRIESGFGEKLRHLDETYKGMKDSFDQLPSRLQIKDAKKELKQEELQAEQILQERQKLIEELATRAKLQDAEKDKFMVALNEKDIALHAAQQEIAFLQQRLQRAEAMRSQDIRDAEHDVGLMNFIKEVVLPQMGKKDLMLISPTGMKRRFHEIKSNIPDGFLKDLLRRGLVDSEGDLTGEGFMLFRRAVKAKYYHINA